MLFNSLEFIFGFLPIVLFGFFQLGGRGYFRIAIAWLFAASLFFYSWWNPANLLVLLPSIFLNYGLGSTIARKPPASRIRKVLLLLGITANLAAIAYFKYANFLISTANTLLSTQWQFEKIILPLGISFFTFQQIAYLVDTYRGETKDNYRFLDYCLFVSFFPHLIAGPLLYHKEVITQFGNKFIYRFNADHLAVGITLFALGLFKKGVLADGIAGYANQIFADAAEGNTLTVVEAWVGALAYTLQLYFDFSGYSDMAIGLGRMMGIQLPINFNSPYQAISIIDFWRRWHITLSTFLRDYLYIPLGGNRKGEKRRYINLIVTMLLGGLWHGAGWTFVLWGGLHGFYLVINHQWRSFRQRVLGHDLNQMTSWGRNLSWLLTFIVVVIGWVIFRAENLTAATAILKGMFGFNGISLPEFLETPFAFLKDWGVQFNELMPNITLEVEQIDDAHELNPLIPIAHIFLLLGIVLFLPNTQQFMQPWLEASEARESSVPSKSWQQKLQQLSWRPHSKWAVICAVLTAIALLQLTNVSEFLYFEF